MKEYVPRKVSYGNDAVFHVVFDYDKANAVSLQGTLITDQQIINKGDVDFTKVLNLEVSLEIGCCCEQAEGVGATKAWRIDERYPNRLVIEVPAEKQSLGEVYATIQFDVPSDKVKDGLFHQTRKMHLCNIVRTEQSQKVLEQPSSEHVLLLSQGEPSIPTSSFERGRNLIVMSRMVQGDLMNRSNVGHEFSPMIYDRIYTPVAPGDTFLYSCTEEAFNKVYSRYVSPRWNSSFSSYIVFYNAKKIEIERIKIQWCEWRNKSMEHFQNRFVAPAKAMYMRISLIHQYQKVKLESIPIKGGLATEWSLSPEDKALGYVHPIDTLEP